jgi:molecular chaperone GrpE
MSASHQPLDPQNEEGSKDTSEVTENSSVAPDAGGEQLSESDIETGHENLAALLEEAQAQVAQYHDQLLRAKADVENIRRRAQEDVSKARKFGTESFAESLIPVKDSLEAALAQSDQTAEAWKEGVELTLRQLITAFERNLMKDEAPAPGEKFDPHRHQAISAVPSEFPEGSVVQLLQKGYTIAERVLRPALVMVSSGKAS